MMSEAEIIENIKHSDSNQIKFAVTDIDGVLRGKVISKKKFLMSIAEGLGFCNVIFGWDMNDNCYDNSLLSGWHTGYPDAYASIDLQTFRTIPWNEQMPFFLADFSLSKEISNACPRTLLKNIRQQCIDLGIDPILRRSLSGIILRKHRHL